MERRQAHAVPRAPAGTLAVTSWIAQVVVAGILAQTLFFKLTYAPETRLIFGRLGGRPAATLVALAELACVLLLVVPRTAVLGALASLAVIAGAIATHVFVIGIAIVDPASGESDGGLLFGLALAVAALSALVLVIRRRELAGWLRHFRVPIVALLLAAASTAAFALDPVNTNHCAKAVSEGDTADIDPLAWRIVDGKLYLNYSAKIQALWEQDAPGRIKRADAAWPRLLAD